MATGQVKPDFPEQIKRSRQKIRDCFKKSHDALLVRENNLLSRVDEIGREYNSKTEELSELIETLNNEMRHCEENLSANKLIDVTEALRATIDKKIQELIADTYTSIEFVWNNQFESGIKHLGNIKLNKTMIPPKGTPPPKSDVPPHVKPVVPNYKTKQQPTAYCCKISSKHKSPEAGELNSPRSLAIHYKTGNIYIADSNNHRVQVFTGNGKYLFMFSDKMNNPVGICVSQNKVFVTQLLGNCINMYELKGKLIKSVGSEGTGPARFKHPHGLDVSDINNNIYVCDCSNNRIQILTQELKYRFMLGIDLLKYPSDVKATRDKVLVLDESDSCISVFNTKHVLIRRLITRGDGKQTSNPHHFDVDRKYNIIMSDYMDHCVYVFNEEGKHIHKFGKEGQGIGKFYHPCGIALDSTGRIIVVCEKNTNCLQFF